MDGMHQNLVNLCSSLLMSQNLAVRKNFEYEHGELDILCNRIYYEIKCNGSTKQMCKAAEQIKRAIRFGQARYGYLVTYDGLVDLLGNDTKRYNPEYPLNGSG